MSKLSFLLCATILLFGNLLVDNFVLAQPEISHQNLSLAELHCQQFAQQGRSFIVSIGQLNDRLLLITSDMHYYDMPGHRVNGQSLDFLKHGPTAVNLQEDLSHYTSQLQALFFSIHTMQYPAYIPLQADQWQAQVLRMSVIVSFHWGWNETNPQQVEKEFYTDSILANLSEIDPRQSEVNKLAVQRYWPSPAFRSVFDIFVFVASSEPRTFYLIDQNESSISIAKHTFQDDGVIKQVGDTLRMQYDCNGIFGDKVSFVPADKWNGSSCSKSIELNFNKSHERKLLVPVIDRCAGFTDQKNFYILGAKFVYIFAHKAVAKPGTVVAFKKVPYSTFVNCDRS